MKAFIKFVNIVYVVGFFLFFLMTIVVAAFPQMALEVLQ